MGGFGSGRCSEVRKPCVDAHGVALRAGELRRGGASGSLSWGDPARPIGAVNFRSTGTRFFVSYRFRDGDKAEWFSDEIFLAPTRAGFGGMRTYFRCPGAECNRRVETPYFAKGRFRCRRCQGLAYESQYDDVEHRARRRANKRHGRLRYGAWMPFAFAPIVRPKGMLRRKFWRMQDSVDEADCHASAARAIRLKALVDRLRKDDRKARAQTSAFDR
jgi:hypothetical protein